MYTYVSIGTSTRYYRRETIFVIIPGDTARIHNIRKYEYVLAFRIEQGNRRGYNITTRQLTLHAQVSLVILLVNCSQIPCSHGSRESPRSCCHSFYIIINAITNDNNKRFFIIFFFLVHTYPLSFVFLLKFNFSRVSDWTY